MNPIWISKIPIKSDKNFPGEASLLDAREQDIALLRTAMDTFDSILGEYHDYVNRAEQHAKVPIKQKWEEESIIMIDWQKKGNYPLEKES